MRKYNKDGKLISVLCNCCGKKLIVEEGILREGSMSVDHVWDFFSEKDGERHKFDICESCYDKMISEFVITPEKEPETELL